MKRRLGINTNCIQKANPIDLLDDIQNAGFDCFFTPSYITDRNTVAKLREKGEKLGLRYEFIHAPFKGVNAMWVESEGTQTFMDAIMHSIDNAAACDVPMIILHASSTWTPPAMTDAGFARYDTLIAHAEKKGVKVAIENLRRKEYYTALLERYKDCAHVGFCYDNGHEHWCSPEFPHIERYADKLLCTHIHDNYYNKDLHVMPFTGDIDWRTHMATLREIGYTGNLTFEFVYGKLPEIMVEDFLATTAKTGRILQEMFTAEEE
jgi:sugar phosphate isomerase/epimerase